MRFDGFVLACIEGAPIFVEDVVGVTQVFIATENVDVGRKSYFLKLNKSIFTALGLVKKPEELAAAAKTPSAKPVVRRQMKINIVKGTDAAVGQTVSLCLDTFEAVAWRAVVTKKLRKPFPAAAGAGAAADDVDDDDYDPDADDDDDFDEADDEVENNVTESELRDLNLDADA